jgi:hypothetical protein
VHDTRRARFNDKGEKPLRLIGLCWLLESIPFQGKPARCTAGQDTNQFSGQVAFLFFVDAAAPA